MVNFHRIIKKNSIKYIIVLIIAIYVNYTFVYKQKPIIQYLCYYSLMGIYIIFYLNKVIFLLKLISKKAKISVLSLLLWFFILCNTIIFPIIHQTYDFSYINIILSIIRQIIQQFFLILLIDNLLSPKSLLKEYMQMNINSGICYVLITVMMIRFPIIKEIWRNTIYISSYDLEKSLESNYFTRFGLVGFSAFDQTIFCTILVSFSLFLLCKNIKFNKKEFSRYYIMLIILLLGNTFYGRSGMMISIFCIGISFCFICYKYGKVDKIIKISIILITLFLGALIGKNYNAQINIYYNWALKPITNFLESGKIGTTSSDAMFRNMYFIPDLNTIFFGTGNYTDQITHRYYMSTDIGYMRPLLFYGIVNQLFGYLMCIFLIIGIITNMKIKYKTSAVLFGFLSFSILFLFELKGEVFYRISGIYFALLVGAVVDNYKNSKQKGKGNMDDISFDEHI